MVSSLIKQRMSSALILHCRFKFFVVHVSHTYRNIYCISDRISRILNVLAIDLSFQMMFSLVSDVIVCAVLHTILFHCLI